MTLHNVEYNKIVDCGENDIIYLNGDNSELHSYGNNTRITIYGYRNIIEINGINCSVTCNRYNNLFSSSKGNWLTLIEQKYDEENCENVICNVKTIYVDGEKIKQDTLYEYKHGKLFEVNR